MLAQFNFLYILQSITSARKKRPYGAHKSSDHTNYHGTKQKRLERKETA